VEFFNTYQIKGETKYAKMGEKNVAIDKHLIVDVFRFPTKVGKNKSMHTRKLQKPCFIILPYYEHM
jgi:hypothetical protein